MYGVVHRIYKCGALLMCLEQIFIKLDRLVSRRCNTSKPKTCFRVKSHGYGKLTEAVNEIAIEYCIVRRSIILSKRQLYASKSESQFYASGKSTLN